MGFKVLRMSIKKSELPSSSNSLWPYTNRDPYLISQYNIYFSFCQEKITEKITEMLRKKSAPIDMEEASVIIYVNIRHKTPHILV